jgi:hypothetical protein
MRFELFLFATDRELIGRAEAAGIDGFVVDWESLDKRRRQAGADTQINADTLEDLVQVRRKTKARVLCRLNGFGAWSAREIEQAVEAGADELLLPMVRDPAEVETALSLVRGRCGLGILIETVAVFDHLDVLASLPLCRAYVGLNDLALQRRTPNLFAALVDGTLERARAPFRLPFGFAALTLPDRGEPIPCRLLIGEMARLGCSFTFLRRSFYRDLAGRDLAGELPRLRAALAAAGARSAEQIARERLELEAAVRSSPALLFVDESA